MARFRGAVGAVGLILLAGLVSLAIACSGDDDDNATGSTSGPSPTPDGVSEMNLTARDFSYDSPSSVASGLVRFRMKNEGSEPHQAQVARLNDGVTEQQFTAALQAGDPSAAFALVSFEGGPNTVSAGQSQTVVNDLKAGKYAFLCFVSSEDGVMHLAKGMVKTFDVGQPPAQAAQAPQTNTRVTLTDFSFEGAETINAGKRTIEVTNNGPQPHELTIIKLGEGYSFQQLQADLATVEGPTAPPPIQDAGGLAAIAMGTKGWLDVDLTAGNYAFICFVPDGQTGAPHFTLGMVRSLSVR